MCKFFSFVSDGRGKVYYFDAKHRRQMPHSFSPDSHTSIATYFLKKPAADDRVNKFEYHAGMFQIDQINVQDDSAAAEAWIESFVKTNEWIELCMAAVSQDGRALEYVKEQTPELCMAAVSQDGRALTFIRDEDIRQLVLATQKVKA